MLGDVSVGTRGGVDNSRDDMSGSANAHSFNDMNFAGSDRSAKKDRVVSDVDANADVLIKQVMVAQKREHSHQALPLLSDSPPAESQPTVKHPRRTREQATKEAGQMSCEAASKASRARRGLDAIKTYRPTRNHVLLAGVAVVMVLRPLLLPGILVTLFFVVLIAYFSLGPDRVAELVVHVWNKIHARRPELAETLRHRAEAMAVRIDAFLDRSSWAWTDRVHVPDLSKPDPEADTRPDPFERLAKEAQDR